MKLSVVIRSKDEAPRLRLVLASLMRQTVPADEIVVVDDGSSDETPSVLAEAASALPLTSMRHESAHGRSAASNAGARRASGEVLLFLDGDTLAAPNLVERHLAVNAAARGRLGRGETMHLRCTRFLRDPETVTPRAGEEARIARLAPAEIERLRVSRAQVMDDFPAIAARAEPGIYPGAGPKRLQALEVDALRHHPDCPVLWAAASGSNQSVDRERFLGAGGFDERLDINEHRELALRLCDAGARMTLVEGAAAFHLTHRSGWRDPLAETGWERRFFAAHPIAAVKLLSVFWACLRPNPPLPPEARIELLPALAAAAQARTRAAHDAARAALGLPPLGVAAPA